MRLRSSLAAAALGLLGALACGPAVAAAAPRASDLDDLVRARSIHCAFFRNAPDMEPAPGPREERAAELLVHYAGIDRSRTRARSINTRSAGSREVTVHRTAHAVHFVEHLAGAYRVTTVHGCNERDRRPGRQRCVAYGAANAMHFDASVTWQPDKVFDGIRHIASHGFCDHGFVESP